MSVSNSPDITEPTEMIEKDRLSKELVFSILHAAYMKPEIDPEGYLWVWGRSGIPYIVVVDESYIEFLASFRFKDGLDRNGQLELINRLNSTTLMVRFSMLEDTPVSEDDSFFQAAYQFPVREGLTPLQLLNYLTSFDTFVDMATDEVEDSLQRPFDS